MAGNVWMQGLGGELREAREKRQLTLQQVAQQLGLSATAVWRYEMGKRKPSPDFVERFLDLVGASQALKVELVQQAAKPDQRRWLAVDMPDLRRQQAALLEITNNATEIIVASPVFVPGLLQTSEYTRAIMVGGDVPPEEIETRVALRVGRREVIALGKCHINAYVGEAALYQRIGGTGVMLRQLQHLLNESQRPNVDLAILPLAAGWHPALDGSFSLFCGAEGTVESVFVGNHISGLFFVNEPEVSEYEAAVERVKEKAMTPAASAAVIAKVISNMEKEL